MASETSEGLRGAGVIQRLPGFALLLALAAPVPAAELEEIVVWGEGTRDSGGANPVSVLNPADFAAINVASTEDLVKFEPSVVVRRRFIGDANGTLGMRGSNMFQTSRSMVFADGVPLHYLLQSRWNGAPRWSMVSASEIARVDLLYGPFSAEYSGNAMGGVVLIETAIPQQREFHFDSAVFLQDFSAYGFNESLGGYRSFISYGDKLGDLSLYLSYNHLANESQPQSFFYGAATASGDARPVSGALPGADEQGTPRRYFGDSGVIDTTSDNYKLKLGYERGAWSSLLNVAYEDRSSSALSPNSYLRDEAGRTVWSGTVAQGGEAFEVPASSLGVSRTERDSLSAGLRLRGELSDRLTLESNLNRFTVLRDQTRASLRHPAAPDYEGVGQVTDYGATGWSSAEIKLRVEEAGLAGLALVGGLRHEAYELNLDVFDSADWAKGAKGAYGSRSGGASAVDAAFVQADWRFHRRWNLALGGRHESFESRRGYYGVDDPATADFDLVPAPSQRESRFSPKFSLAYAADDDWRLRYSLARAYRFPIVEELFSQYQAYNSINEANPELAPEKGLHHNLALEHGIGGGQLRLNLFQESVEDVIEAQALVLPGGASLRTFIPLDRVDTRGVELIAEGYGFFHEQLDLRFNLAWTKSRIVANAADPTLAGKHYPRMPEWRVNLLATWHFHDSWQAALNYQYASDSFGRLDNSDQAKGVYGAQDGYSRLGLKSTWRFAGGFSAGLGVDNLSNEISYVAHPWPGRTWYFNLAYELQ